MLFRSGGGWGLGEGCACKALSGEQLADAPGEGSQGPWAKRGACSRGLEDWQGLRKERKDVGRGIGQTVQKGRERLPGPP